MASTLSSVPAPRLQLATVKEQKWPIMKQTTLLIEYAPSPIPLEIEALDKIFAMPGVQTAFDAAKKRLNPTDGEAVVLVEVHLIGAYVLEEGTGQEFEVSKIQFISTLEKEGKVLVHWPIWHKPQVQKKSSRPAAKKQRSKSTTRRAAAKVATESAPEADQDQQKPSKPVSNKRKRPTQQTGAKQQTDANRDEILEDLNAEQAVATEEYDDLENRQETKRMKPMDNESETEDVSVSMNPQLQNDEGSDETRANRDEIFENSSAKQDVVTRGCEELKNQREPKQVKPTDNRIEAEDDSAPVDIGIEIEIVSAPTDQQLQNVDENDETRANREEIFEGLSAKQAVETRECEGLENQRESEQMKPMDTGMAEDVSGISGIEIEVVSAPRDQQPQKVEEESHETLREQIRMLRAENAEKDKKLEEYQYMNEVQQIIDRSSNVLYKSQKKALEERVRDLESQLEVATEDNAKMVDVYNETTSTFDAQWQKLKNKYEQAKTKKENLKAEVVLLRNQLNATEAKRDELSRKVGTLLIEKEELSKQNINKQAMINHGVNMLANHVALVNKLSADLYFYRTGIQNNAPLFQM